MSTARGGVSAAQQWYYLYKYQPDNEEDPIPRLTGEDINGDNTDQDFGLEQTMFTPACSQAASHTGYAFSAGAGASVRLAGQFWADVDAKYFRLSRDRDIMRVGGGVSFRF